MHICIREDAYRADRCEVARIFRCGDPPLPKIAKTKNAIHAKLTNCGARNFQREREREEERCEDGIKRNMEYEDGAMPTSSPCLFRTPFRWSVYIGESVGEFWPDWIICLSPDSFYHNILLILALSMILWEGRKEDRKKSWSEIFWTSGENKGKKK